MNTTTTPHPSHAFTDYANPRPGIQHHHYRPSRGLVFTLGLAAGIFIGWFATMSPGTGTAAQVKIPALVCVGLANGRYFIKNQTGQDYRLEPADATLFERGELGLMPTAAKLAGPVFIPAGESGAVTIEPLPKGGLVLFDIRHGFKVELKAK
jgi:hypothetical protein